MIKNNKSNIKEFFLPLIKNLKCMNDHQNDLHFQINQHGVFLKAKCAA